MEVDTRMKRVLIFYLFKKILAVRVAIWISKGEFCPLGVTKLMREGELGLIIVVILNYRGGYVDLGFGVNPAKESFWGCSHYRMIVIVGSVSLGRLSNTFSRFSRRKHLAI